MIIKRKYGPSYVCTGCAFFVIVTGAAHCKHPKFQTGYFKQKFIHGAVQTHATPDWCPVVTEPVEQALWEINFETTHPNPQPAK